MTHSKALKTRDLARSVGLSVQQVRNYEMWGFLPPTERRPNGYRIYTIQHLAALQVARTCIRGFGWQSALAMMRALHNKDLHTALDVINACHAELHTKRLHIEQMLTVLHTMAQHSDAWEPSHWKDAVRVSEAARRVGVQVTTLHFWEKLGLVQPQRDPTSKYRLYDGHQLYRLQVIVLLRELGYSFEVMRAVLDEVGSGKYEKVLDALEKRRSVLTTLSWACMEATETFSNYVRQFYSVLLEQHL
jgi:DNA-binding transcriptional MerR regulator